MYTRRGSLTTWYLSILLLLLPLFAKPILIPLAHNV